MVLVAEAVAHRDAVGYIRTNLEFHRTLYLRAQAPAMLAMAETVWLQLGRRCARFTGGCTGQSRHSIIG